MAFTEKSAKRASALSIRDDGLNERESSCCSLAARRRISNRIMMMPALQLCAHLGRCGPCMLCFSGGFGARCVLRTRPMGGGTARRPGRTEHGREENGIIYYSVLLLSAESRKHHRAKSGTLKKDRIIPVPFRTFLDASHLSLSRLTLSQNDSFLVRTFLDYSVSAVGAGRSTSRLPRPSPSKPYSNLKSENTPHQRPTTTGGKMGLA